MNFVEIRDSKLNLEEISNLVSSPTCGATSIFIGTTRNTFEEKDVIQLEYEAYIPMAKKVLYQICEEIRKKWNVFNIAIYHRLGIVPVQDSSIIIAISSPHRHEALEAVSFAINTVKAKVPIWKKEVYASGSVWKENQECSWKCK